jgi:hypothetical protein
MYAPETVFGFHGTVIHTWVSNRRQTPTTQHSHNAQHTVLFTLAEVRLMIDTVFIFGIMNLPGR